MTLADLSDKLAQLNSLLLTVNRTGNLAEVLKHVVESICRHSEWTMSSIMRLDPELQLSHLVCENNPLRSASDPLSDRWPLDTSPVARVVQRAVPLVIADAQQAKNIPEYQQDARLWGYHTVVILPLTCRFEDRQAMVLSVQSVDRVAVDELELRFLSAFAQIASVAIEKAQSLQKERDVARRLSESARARSGLMSLILSDAEPDQVIAEIAELLNTPVIFYDQTETTPVLAVAGQRVRRLPATAAGVFAREFRKTESHTVPDAIPMHLPELGVAAFERAIAYPLYVGTLFAGGLIIGSDEEEGTDAIDELNLQEAKFVAAMLLMKSLAQFRAMHETLSDLFLTIFSGNWRTEQALIARGHELGVDFLAPQMFFGISGVADTDAGQHAEHQLLSRTCQRLGISAPIIRDGPVYLIMAKLSNPSAPPTDVWAQQLLSAMKPVWGEGATLVVSRVCRTLKDYANARREIDEALNMSQAFGRTGLIRASDFGGYGLLLSSSGHGRIEAFIESTLGALEAHDAGKGSDTVETVKSYIDSGCRFQSSADQLGIHVTTLRYRIERIQDLFGLDFTNADTRFDFDLALRLREFRSSPKNQ